MHATGQRDLFIQYGELPHTGDVGLVSQATVAHAWSVSPSTVSRWRVEPVRRIGKFALYDLRDVVRYRMATTGRLDLNQEKAQLAHVQRCRQELQLARERGELLRADDVELVWSLYISTARARMLTLPEVAAPRVAGATVPEAVFILRGLVHEALTELAGYDPADFQQTPPQPDATAPTEAPTPTKRRRRTKKAASDVD